MPSAPVDYRKVAPLLANKDHGDVVSTPFGLSLLEIQGVLNLPSAKPEGADENYIKVDEIYDAVKFGRLQFDEQDKSKVTLFIGQTQRLLGKFVELDPPLGVLKVATDDSNDVEMVDIVRRKMIFSTRPLPIM